MMAHVLHFLVLLTPMALALPNTDGCDIPTMAKIDNPRIPCQELITKSYIASDGCASKDVVTQKTCVGRCSREDNEDMRCVGDGFTRKMVALHCPDGSIREIMMQLTTSCRCKACTQRINLIDTTGQIDRTV